MLKKTINYELIINVKIIWALILIFINDIKL